MSRLFSFGCSFTCYWYPTWADFLSNSSHFSYYENWAKSGRGNRGIFNRLNEAIVKANISSNDTVVIMWSTIFREDRFLDNSWVVPGGIYNQQFYPRDWVLKYFSPEMGLIETANYVNASYHILENLGCNYAMSFLQTPGIDPDPSDGIGEKISVSDKISPLLNNMLSIPRLAKKDFESFEKEIRETNDFPLLYNENGKLDGHPNPQIHYHYLKENIVPIIGINNFDEDRKIYKLASEWEEFIGRSDRDQNQAPMLGYKIKTKNSDMLP